MAAGDRRTFSRTQKQPLRDPPNVICAGSVVRHDSLVATGLWPAYMRAEESGRPTGPWLQLVSIQELISSSTKRGNAIAAGSRTNRVANLESGCFLRIHFNKFGAIPAGAERPIDDVTKHGSRSGNDHDVASSAIEKIFNSFQFVPRQLFTEPDHAWAHACAATRTARDILVFSEVAAIDLNRPFVG